VTHHEQKNQSEATVLLLEGSVLVRMAIAAYLRNCGYRVIEAATSDEAFIVLRMENMCVEIVFSAVEVSGALDAFALSQWVRRHRPDTRVVMAGTPKSASAVAGRLCEVGPHLEKPYEPEAVEDYIRRLLAMQNSTPR
jgi:DNA-binding NtrC family response regulator